MKLRKIKTARRIAWWLGCSVEAAVEWLRGDDARRDAQWIATGRRD